MRKVPRSHFNILDTRILKDTGSFSFSAFRNRETQNVKSAQEPFQHFGYRDFKGHGVFLFMFSVLTTLHGKKQLMNIEQVVETSAQVMNVRHGGSCKQSTQGCPMCRFS
jgi:hypothetical protein